MSIYRVQYCIVVASFCWAMLGMADAHASSFAPANKSLRVAVIYIEEPPYLYTDDNHQYKGILPSLAKALSRELGLTLSYVPTARNALEKVLADDQADTTWLSPKWVKSTTTLQFSTPLIVHREFLFSFTPFAEVNSQDNTLNWLKNKSVCVRQYYKYPNLEPYFQQKVAQAIEVSNQTPLIKLFRKGRCDLLYLDEFRAAWMINRFKIKRKVWRSSSSLENSDLSFVFSSKWQDKLPIINQAINKIKESGELDSILANNLYPIDLINQTESE